MINLQNVTLPVYTKGEEIFNAVSHGIGLPMGILFAVLCATKAGQTNSVVGSLIFAVSVMVLYTCSALYHSLKRSDAKKIMRLLDHSTIFILITGTSIAMTVICVYPFNKTLAVCMSVLSFVLSTVGVSLTFIDQEKYKRVQMILYFVVGGITVFIAYPVYKNCDDALTLLALAVIGGLVYSIGTVFYVVGKKKKYFHCIFHIFVLCGTLLHFLAIYKAI